MKWEDLDNSAMFNKLPIASGDTYDRYVPLYKSKTKHTLFNGRSRVLEIRKPHGSDLVQIWLLNGWEPALKRANEDLSLSIRETRDVPI